METTKIEWSRCPICGSAKVTYDDGIGECGECTHKFRQFVPAEILSTYFDAKYWNQDKNHQGIMTVEYADGWERWVNARLRILNSFDLINHEHPENYSILEFGCSEGMLLYQLKNKGYKVMGNDVCAIAIDGMNKFGIEISTKPIEEFAKENLKFDLIMSFHVVEHLRDPRSVLEALSNMLKDGGKMLMHVPIDDIEVDNRDHFHFFTDESCKRLMESCTTQVKTDYSHYRAGIDRKRAMAATYVGTKKA